MKASRLGAISVGLAAIGLSGSLFAQNVAVSPAYPGHITDTRTGRVWTPSWDSLDAYQPTDPSHPVNREFDPRAQSESVPGMVRQRPRVELMGTVPISTPAAPVMTVDTPSLQAVPGQRWISILYVTNNSPAAINPIIDCHFTNHGQKVESVRLYVPTAGPGQRLGMAVRGPAVDMFVDKVVCVPMAPV